MDFDLTTSTPMHSSHLVASKINDSRIDLSWLDDSTIETGWKLEYRADPNLAFSATPRATLDSAYCFIKTSLCWPLRAPITATGYALSTP
jgi:hypothetical protein